MDKKDGKIKKGEHLSPATEFKKGTHWRTPKPYWSKEWLFNEYITNQRSASDIAEPFGIHDNAILFWLKKHGIVTRTVKEARKIKHWGLSGSENPMYYRRGDKNYNWKGGCTPERQEFYMSREWINAASLVWSRDKATCQRCGAVGIKGILPIHIHHIVSFENKELRADPNNLILLCRKCHIFIHSKRNTQSEFIK